MSDRRVTIAQIADEQLGTNGTEWVQVLATIHGIKPDSMYYPSCPHNVVYGDTSTRICMKKLTEQGGQWFCENHPNAPVDEPFYRYVLNLNIMDHSGNKTSSPPTYAIES